MNILVVSHYGIYSDFSISYVHAQAVAYAALGHRVRVIVPVALGKRDRDGKRFSSAVVSRNKDGVEIMDLRFCSLSRYGEKHFNTVSAIAALQCNFSKLLKDFSPDIIHAHTLGFDSKIGAWLKRKLHCPLVVTTHGSDTSIPVEQGKLQELKAACAPADAVVAVSSKLAQKLRTCGTQVPITSILNGFRLGYLPEAAEKKPASMVQVSNLLGQKRIDVSLRAFAMLKAKNPAMTMTIIGQGPERENLETLCKELSVSDSVRFLGKLPNNQVLQELAQTQFFVMPSVREGFGIVYLEAMASGCITIGTEGEGIADLIVSGENGFLVPPDNPASIATIIENCLNDTETAQKIAQNGKQAALALTWERTAQQYLTLFQQIIHSKGDE